MTDIPLISVIIPAYNARQFIAAAINSVLDQEGQVDLIVVDDGSTDGTTDEVTKMGKDVRLIQSPKNEGLPNALNRGLELARGQLIGFLDADDTWLPDRLGAERELFSHHADIAAVWGKTRIVFLSDGDAVGLTSPDWPPQHFPALGSMLFRKEVFERLGRFNPVFQHAQDIDFLARAQEMHLKLLRHEAIVLTWRRHEANMTNNVELDRDYLVTAIRQALHRRRSASIDSGLKLSSFGSCYE